MGGIADTLLAFDPALLAAFVVAGLLLNKLVIPTIFSANKRLLFFVKADILFYQ